MSDTEVPFQVVKHKKFRRKYNSQHQQYSTHQESCYVDDDAVNSASVLERLHKCRLKLLQSTFLQNLVDCFADCQLMPKSTVLTGFDDFVSVDDQTLNYDPDCQLAGVSDLRPLHCVVAYGLGHFSTCPIACYQFALLLLLADILKEGKRQSSSHTLYYMPHCGKPLYNNLLWANWHPDSIANTVLLGNSFSTIFNSHPSHVLEENYRYIYEILPHTNEHELKGLPSDLQDVFNDISLHTFNTQSVRLTDELWSDADEPHYCGNEFDQEIVWSKQSPRSSTRICITSSSKLV